MSDETIGNEFLVLFKRKAVADFEIANFIIAKNTIPKINNLLKSAKIPL
jgi:hypothetical protein